MNLERFDSSYRLELTAYLTNEPSPRRRVVWKP